MKVVRRLWSKWGRTALLGACLFAGFAFGCPAYHLYGVMCPCCGVSRAWIAFLNGKIAMAFRYHALFPLIPVVGVLFVLLDRLPENLHKLAERLLILSSIVIFSYGVMRWCGFVNMP